MEFDLHKKLIKSWLPDHYKLDVKNDGIHCYSDIGINEDSNEWQLFLSKLKDKLSGNFLEVFHQTSTNHLRFTVFLRNDDVSLISYLQDSIFNHSVMVDRLKYLALDIKAGKEIDPDTIDYILQEIDKL